MFGNNFTKKTIFINIQNHEELAINSNSAQLFETDGIFEICQNNFAECNIAVPKYRTCQNWCAKQPLATKS